MPIIKDRDYYCSMKFKYLKIDIESNLTYCCHAAKPHIVDRAWLKDNPGQLFNTPLLMAERTMMLKNERNASCEQNCWPAEDIGAFSPRMYQNGIVKTHTDINTRPEKIDFTLTSDCNLTCSYCCKEYSSAWKRDLADHGDYNIGNERYTLTDKDKILYKLSQNEKSNSSRYQELIEEINLIVPSVNEFLITGGEPFLNNQLLSIVKMAKSCNKILLYTGLGVSQSRFKKILNQLKLYSNVELHISAENVGKYLEFNRYGINADEFMQKVELIKESNIKFKFHNTLSNLTLFGLAEFYKVFGNFETAVNFSHHPDFMAVNVLDSLSKENLLHELKLVLLKNHYDSIEQSIQTDPTEQQRLDLKTFINRFVQHRNLDLNIYPPNFIDWINKV